MIYISGAMTGVKDFNYPEFNRVTEGLRQAGNEVVNPVEICSHLPEGSQWHEYMNICIPAIQIFQFFRLPLHRRFSCWWNSPFCHDHCCILSA